VPVSTPCILSLHSGCIISWRNPSEVVSKILARSEEGCCLKISTRSIIEYDFGDSRMTNEISTRIKFALNRCQKIVISIRDFQGSRKISSRCALR
jgi:hypothetical protein